MPELPEVTTVARYLDKQLKNQIIKKVLVFHEKMVKNILVKDLIKNIEGEKITGISNQAKYLLFLTENFCMISHLRMEGKWVVEDFDTHAYPLKHNLLSLEFDNFVARYYDTRKFGTIECYSIDEYKSSKTIQNIGPIPLDGMVTCDYLFPKLNKSSIAIKTLLLDQKIIAGLGNIYVNEVLFLSKIMPDRPSKTITKEECKRIIDASEQVLFKAIELKGTTIHSFSSGNNESGGYQNELKVHMREKKPCFVCQELIKKMKVNGRGTYFCVNCQK